jgi:hypothetical protein
MTNVIPLPRPADAEPTIAELSEMVRVLAAALAKVAVNEATRDARLAAIEARLPKPAYLPRGWPTVKHAAALAAVSPSSIYRAIKRGDVLGFKLGNATVIHPDDLAKLIS